MTVEHPLNEQSDDMLRLLDSFPAMIWLKDTQNNCIRVNKLAAAQTLGLTPKDFRSLPSSQAYPNEFEKFYTDDLIVITTGQPRLGIVEQITCQSGERRWIRTDKIPYRDKNGSIVGVIVFAVDVNDSELEHARLKESHRSVEKSLEETSNKLEIITSNMPGAVFQFLRQTDGTMCFPFITDSVTQMLGFTPAEITGDVQVVFDRIHPEDIGELHEMIERSAATLDVFKHEGRFLTKANKERWLHTSSVPTRLANGDVLFNGLLMDITSLKSAHAQINHLNEELEHRVLILASVNKELELLTHKLESAYEQAMHASRLKSEFVANISHEVRTPISAVIGMTGLLLDTILSGEQTQFVKIIRESAESLLTIINDILDFSKIEADKIELESIAFNLSQIIHGCADLLSSAASQKGLKINVAIHPSAPPTVIGDPVRLRQILLNLCSNAVKFTERGEITVRVTRIGDKGGADLLKFEVVDTGIGMTNSAQRVLFQPFVQADGSTTRRYGGTGLGLSICKRLVELMGGQIGVNSKHHEGSTFWFAAPFAKFTEDRFKPLDLEPTQTANLVHLDKSALPPGIIENRTSLSAVPQLLPEGGGSGSSSFEPFQSSGDSQIDCSGGGLLSVSGQKVLLAEDNQVMRELGLRQLQKLGLEVDAVSNGKLVLEAMQHQRYAMIIMDCQMPEMDGFEATEQIRKEEAKNPFQARIPIIAMTASAMKGDREQCVAAGMDDYLIKPVDPKMLRSVLEKWIARIKKDVSAREQPSTGNNTPVNVTKLRELYGADAQEELLRSFIAEGKNILSAMAECMEKHDDRELAVQAHQLKGLSAVMTAEAMQQCSLELERAAKICAWEQAAVHLKSVEMEFSAVTNFINQLLEQQQA